MIKALKRLSEPFPDRSSAKHSFRTLLGVGLFVSVFLFVIRPFGIRGDDTLLLLICSGFGMITLVFGWLYDVLFRFVLKVRTDLPSWTLGKWVLQSMGLLVWIALGNYIYVQILFHVPDFTLSFLFEMILNTLFVGIFPVVFSGLMIQMRAIRANQEKAEEMQPQVEQHALHTASLVQLTPEANRQVALSSMDIRFVEAMQNYVTVHFMVDGALQKELLRSTIASMETQLKDTAVVRCHRSYLVNVDAIEQVSGNAQGLKLRLQDVAEQEVPVSRSYIAKVRQLLD